ncbi:hypothetical protein ACLQ28_18465 [Micromonospora sp. DT201]|uniref:hypothetical protein n=1 Tax=Micromonospora sp. DT201 TaxID=3393442 RepID=UPI003CE8C8FB
MKTSHLCQIAYLIQRTFSIRPRAEKKFGFRPRHQPVSDRQQQLLPHILIELVQYNYSQVLIYNFIKRASRTFVYDTPR